MCLFMGKLHYLDVVNFIKCLLQTNTAELVCLTKLLERSPTIINPSRTRQSGPGILTDTKVNPNEKDVSPIIVTNLTRSIPMF